MYRGCNSWLHGSEGLYGFWLAASNKDFENKLRRQRTQTAKQLHVADRDASTSGVSGRGIHNTRLFNDWPINSHYSVDILVVLSKLSIWYTRIARSWERWFKPWFYVSGNDLQRKIKVHHVVLLLVILIRIGFTPVQMIYTMKTWRCNGLKWDVNIHNFI